MIALTFDDGPNVPYTSMILDLLKEFRARATFFVVGKWIKEAPAIVTRASREGHEIGNHTYSHPCLNVITLEHAKNEIETGQRLSKSKLFRAPFGNIPGWMDPKLSVGWDVHGSDWMVQNAEAISRPILDYLDSHPRAIVLLHDGHYSNFGANRQGTVEATRKILEKYPRERFVTVSEYQHAAIS